MQHTHAKFIDEKKVEFPPINDKTRGIINYFADHEQLMKDGYKPYVSTPCPKEDGHTYEAFYSDGKKIKQSWRQVSLPEAVEVAIPTEEQRRQAYISVTDGMEAELAYKTRKGYPVEELKAIENKIDEMRAQIKSMYPEEVNNG